MDRPCNPVFGAVLALTLTVVALMLLILLLYTTINQMRPAMVIEAIHDLILTARECQRGWLGKTRRSPEMSGGLIYPDRWIASCTLKVRRFRHGCVYPVALDRITAVIFGRLNEEQPG